MIKIVCPNCGKENTWQPENSNKPFCSARCKLIDLGEWANEQRSIPGKTIVESERITLKFLDNQQ